ncbi:MAG: ABC transporter permease, partial [Bacteroidetes bacterium]|nr:ABC transporter permease [Bacteroidota bacterium]
SSPLGSFALLLLVLLVVLLVEHGKLVGLEQEEIRKTLLGFWGGYLIVYTSIAHAITSRTLGKWACGIRVCRIDGRRLGLIKSVAFGAAIGMIACYKGFTCKGGAEGVGSSTTQATVVSCVFVLLADYVLAVVLL